MLGKQVSWFAAACVAAAILAGGCGDDDPAPAPVPMPDLTGYWRSTSQTATFTNSVIAALSQTGDTVSGYSSNTPLSGTVGAYSATLVVDIGLPTDYAEAVMTALGPDLLTGTVDIYIGGALVDSGTFTMERFTPSGQLQLSGPVAGEAVSIDTTDLACGIVWVEGSEVWADVIYATPTGVTEVMFRPNPTALGTGTFTTPTEIVVEFQETTAANTYFDFSAAGTVTITKFDPDGFTGSFSFTQNGGGTMTGSFDVPWNIVMGTPF